MKRHALLWPLCLAIAFLVAGTAWAADQVASPEDTPAILASLGPGGAVVLDNQEAMAIRGEGTYLYVLVKILGINALDFGPGVQWTWNPLDFRYGAWGGLGWTGNGEPADLMDTYFRMHDEGATDLELIALLESLKTTYSRYWGLIYAPGTLDTDESLPQGLNTPYVYVSGISFIGNRFFFGWKKMPYTEYARREALTAMGVLVLGKSLFP